MGVDYAIRGNRIPAGPTRCPQSPGRFDVPQTAGMRLIWTPRSRPGSALSPAKDPAAGPRPGSQRSERIPQGRRNTPPAVPPRSTPRTEHPSRQPTCSTSGDLWAPGPASRAREPGRYRKPDHALPAENSGQCAPHPPPGPVPPPRPLRRSPPPSPRRIGPRGTRTGHPAVPVRLRIEQEYPHAYPSRLQRHPPVPSHEHCNGPGLIRAGRPARHPRPRPADRVHGDRDPRPR